MSGRRGHPNFRRDYTGFVPSSGALATPLSLVTSVPVDRYFQSDQGVTSGATTTAWADQSGNAKHAVGTARAVIASALNGKPAIQFNGTTDVLTTSSPVAATPVFYWGIARVDTFLAFARLIGGDGNNSALLCNSASPNLTCFNGTGLPNNSGATVGAFFRFSNIMQNTTADTLLVKAVPAGGLPIGASGQTGGLTFGTGGGIPCACTWVALGVWLGIPTAPEQAALDAFATSFWGAGLTT